MIQSSVSVHEPTSPATVFHAKRCLMNSDKCFPVIIGDGMNESLPVYFDTNGFSLR